MRRGRCRTLIESAKTPNTRNPKHFGRTRTQCRTKAPDPIPQGIPLDSSSRFLTSRYTGYISRNGQVD
jgi:hypothetical protein